MDGNLVLTRNVMQRVFIQTDSGLVKVTILPEKKIGQTRLSFEAPPNVGIDREEVFHRKNPDRE